MVVLSLSFPFFFALHWVTLFTLGPHPTSFSFGSRLTEGKLVSSKSLSTVIFLPSHKVASIFPRTFYWCFLRFSSSRTSLMILFVFLDPRPLTIAPPPPPKPHFPFLLQERGVLVIEDGSSSMLSMCSHIGVSLQLTKTHSWYFGIHDTAVNATGNSMFSTFYSEITTLRLPFSH